MILKIIMGNTHNFIVKPKLKAMYTYNVFSCRRIIVTPPFCRIMQKICAFIIPICILRFLSRILLDLIKLVNNLPWNRCEERKTEGIVPFNRRIKKSTENRRLWHKVNFRKWKLYLKNSLIRISFLYGDIKRIRSSILGERIWGNQAITFLKVSICSSFVSKLSCSSSVSFFCAEQSAVSSSIL